MIVLYNPPSSETRKPVLPMSLLALGAALEGRWEYRIVDANLGEDCLRVAEQTSADVVAMTVMPGPQLKDAVSLARQLKAARPRTPIVWGGYFPTQHHDVCLRSGLVDFVLRGHADHTFPSFLRALLSKDPLALEAVSGLAWSGGVNGLAEVPDPEALRDFPYERLDVARYVRPTFMGRRTLPHHSSYGCPFTCNFCAVVNLVEGSYRAQSAKRTALVVKKLVDDYAIDSVELYDNNFFVDEARVLEFAERIEPLSLGWWGEGRIDTMLRFSDATWARMRRSGLRMVFLGAEAATNEALRRMNKGGTATAEKTLELAGRMRSYGIVPELSFVIGSPPEPAADAERTIAFIRKLKRVNPEAEIVLYLYTPVPLAGELYSGAEARGFRFPETLEEWVSQKWMGFAQRRSLAMPWVSSDLRRKVQDFERVLNAYYPTATDRKLNGPRRLLLRSVSAWRYHLGLYRFALELRALNRVVRYQRPETSGL